MFVDVETTGMSPGRARVIEVAAIRVEDGEIVDSFTSFVDPGTPVPYQITRITGISDGDVAGQPRFDDIADRLFQLFDGAILVAHNARFDYSFLKNEFLLSGLSFTPKQLCTVKLSRALYPEQPRHRLADLISYHGFSFTNRHRAYDDTYVLVQFWQKLQQDHTLDAIDAAIKQQFASPSIPRHLDAAAIRSLPTSAGVYVFEDEDGTPLYIGKSINIKKRVLSHFTRDTSESKEFKISQNIRSVSAIETGGELAALLLESSMIKEHMPVHNRMLRRVRTLTATKKQLNDHGYIVLSLAQLTMADVPNYPDIVALHPRRSSAKDSLLTTVKTYDLCPKLCGLESPRGACFAYQLGKCRGACIGKESAESYNRRVDAAYSGRSIDDWPYAGPVTIQEKLSPYMTGYIVNNWIIEGVITAEPDSEPTVTRYTREFDLDAYAILRSYLLRHANRLTIQPYRGEFDD